MNVNRKKIRSDGALAVSALTAAIPNRITMLRPMVNAIAISLGLIQIQSATKADQFATDAKSNSMQPFP